MSDPAPGPTPAEDARGRAEPAEQLWHEWRQDRGPELGPFLARWPDLSPAQLLAVLRVDQQERWRRGDRVSVEAYLERVPALQGEPETVLDLVYSEVVLREKLGEAPQLEELVRRFPHHEAALHRHTGPVGLRRRQDGVLPLRLPGHRPGLCRRRSHGGIQVRLVGELQVDRRP